ncbi:MAG: helix-turn-helix domain-containing protein [Chloroflexi bacterium]|nr:helix-turn-helix domain-containing protein [Chloroflexota bacterium]
MMTQAKASEQGIELAFADGCTGTISFSDIPEIGSLSNLDDLDLPNPYEVVLRNRCGETVELPWDFVRHYCDSSYRPRIEQLAASGRSSLGDRIRRLRESARMTQEELARAAGSGRVTLVRIENGDRSPRYDTLTALGKTLGHTPADPLA